MHSNLILGDEGDLHFEDFGVPAAPALVFVHGWCCSTAAWKTQLEGFREYRRIAVDLPGHGLSRWRERPFTMDLFADKVVAAMDRAGVAQAVLVGHSNGAPVIRQVLRRHPQRVSGLVIVDGPLKSFFNDPAQVEAMLSSMSGEHGDENFATRFVDPMLKPMRHEEDRAAVRAMMCATPQWVRLAAGRAAFDPAIWTDEKIGVPVHQILASSPFWTEEYRRFTEEVAPGSTWRTVDGVSHFVMIDAPVEFEAEVRAFITRIRFAPK